MPKHMELWNQHIAVEKGKEVDARTQQTVDNWSLVFTDKVYGDVIRITFREEARDHIVTGLKGLVVADRIPSVRI